MTNNETARLSTLATVALEDNDEDALYEIADVARGNAYDALASNDRPASAMLTTIALVSETRLARIIAHRNERIAARRAR